METVVLSSPKPVAFFLTLMETPALFEDIMTHLLRQARQWTQGFVARRLAGLVRRFQAAGSPSAPMADTLRRLLAILEAPGAARPLAAHGTSASIRAQAPEAAPTHAGRPRQAAARPRARFPQRLLRTMLLTRLAALSESPPDGGEASGDAPCGDALHDTRAARGQDHALAATSAAPPRPVEASGQMATAPVAASDTPRWADRSIAIAAGIAADALLTWAQWVLDDWYDRTQTPYCLRFETVQAPGGLPPLAPWPTRAALREPMTRAP